MSMADCLIHNRWRVTDPICKAYDDALASGDKAAIAIAKARMRYEAAQERLLQDVARRHADAHNPLFTSARQAQYRRAETYFAEKIEELIQSGNADGE